MKGRGARRTVFALFTLESNLKSLTAVCIDSTFQTSVATHNEHYVDIYSRCTGRPFFKVRVVTEFLTCHHLQLFCEQCEIRQVIL